MKLTKKEQQVMSLLATGLDAMDVAICMGISIRTIHAHLCNIYKKLDVKNRSGAIVAYMKLVQTGDLMIG